MHGTMMLDHVEVSLPGMLRLPCGDLVGCMWCHLMVCAQGLFEVALFEKLVAFFLVRLIASSMYCDRGHTWTCEGVQRTCIQRVMGKLGFTNINVA